MVPFWFRPIVYGVLKGTILIPILYNFHFNLGDDLEVNIIAYLDDTTKYALIFVKCFQGH